MIQEEEKLGFTLVLYSRIFRIYENEIRAFRATSEDYKIDLLPPMTSKSTPR